MTKAEVIARICGESRLNGATIYDHRADLNIGVDTRGDLSFDDAVTVPFSLLREAVRELAAKAER